MDKTAFKAGLYSSICTLGVWLAVQTPGCATSPTTSQSLGAVNTTNGIVATDVGNQADNVDTNVGHVKAGVTPQQRGTFGPYFDNVQTATNHLRDDKKTLETTQATQIKQAQDAATADETKIKDLTTQLAAANHSILTHWLAVGCAVSVGVILLGCFFIYQSKYTLGIGMVVGGIADISISILIIQYAGWFALGGAVLLLAGIGFGIYELIKNWKTIQANLAVQKKATFQTVQIAEAAKQLLPPDARAQLFGFGAVDGDADHHQDNDTKKIVRSIRETPGFKLALKPNVPAVSITSTGTTIVAPAPVQIVPSTEPIVKKRVLN